MSDMKTRLTAIRALEDERGRVTPERLVRAAADSRHPLHGDFDWDDKSAGHKHRLDTARKILASVRVVVTTETKRIATVGYVRDPEAGRAQGMVSTVRLRTERDNAVDSLHAEVSRIIAIFERARELSQALDLETEFQAAFDAAITLSSRLRRGPAISEDGEGAPLQ